VGGDLAFILFLFIFGIAIRAMKIPMEEHPVLAVIFGGHGVIFGVVLPLAIYLLIPAIVIWAIAWFVSFLRETE